MGNDGPDGFREWERSVAAWWNTVLDDPAFVRGMGDAMAGRSQVAQQVQEGVDRTLDAWHLPSKRDLVRVAHIASLLEDRLVGLEDTVADLTERLDRIEKEALRARIDAAEVRLMLDQRLDAIDAGLARLSAPPAKPAPRKR
ncbi:MAG: hypothetical protein ABMA64_26325 [Myxococcota bacterium]